MSQPKIRELRLTRFITQWNGILSYLFSGGLWVFGSFFYLSNISDDWWRYRDDSVIHLSQARNFSLYGSIGLSAGDRVEAMSSPLNFAISWVFFGINPDISYQKYLDIFVLLTLLVLSISINFILTVAFKKKFSNYTRHILLANTALFIMIISSWTTYGWLISGMENILCVTVFLFLLANLLSDRVSLPWTIILFTLLGICRIELAALIAPILLFAARRIVQEKKSRILLLSLPVAAWALIHGVRFWYFGHLLPNTATALNKNLSSLTIMFLGIQYLILMRKIFFESKTFIIFKDPLNLASLTLLSGLGVWRIDSSSYSTMYKVILVISFILILGLVLAIQNTPQSARQIHVLILVSLIPVNHYFLFGPARLSAFRIVGIFVIPIVVLLIILVYEHVPKVFKDNKQLILGLAGLILVLMAVSKLDKPRNLCCSISPSESFISAEAQKIFGRPELRNPRPIVANPDLGKASFSKDFMNVDLGLIGEPLLAKIIIKSPGLVDEYLLDIVAPDVIELHGHWSCAYKDILQSPKFLAEWKLSWSGYVSKEMNPGTNIGCPRNGEYSIWTRSVPQDELNLSRVIANGTFQEYSRQIQRQVDICKRNSDACGLLSRSVIRNKANLIQSGNLEKTVNLLQGTRIYELDRLRILQPRGWDTKAFHLVNQILKEDTF